MGQLTRNGQRLLLQAYDKAGRIISTAGSFSGQTNTVGIAYDALFRRSSASQSAGLTTTLAYDSQDRVSNIAWSGSPASYEILTRNRSGMVTQSARENSVFVYAYSPRNELVEATQAGGAITLPYGYTNQTMTYGKSGSRLTHASSDFLSYDNFVYQKHYLYDGSFTYFRPSGDGLGRLQSKIETSRLLDFKYLPNGQLQTMRRFDTAGALQKTVNYYYDGLGRRIAKVSTPKGQSSTIVNYSHLLGEDKILTARIISGSSVKESLYVDGPGIDDHLFEISDSTGIKSYKTDHIGTVINSNAFGGFGYYPPFGENLGTPMNENGFVEPVTYGFAGREYDAETGMYYFRARTYDPTTGTFLTKDPLGPEAGGDINPYRYAGNNPLNFTDPLGLKVDGPIYTPADFNAALATPAGQAAMNNGFIKSDIRYVYTEQGVMDMRHVQAAYNNTQSLMSSGVPAGLAGATTYAAGVGVGVGVELTQAIGIGSRSYGNANSSAFSPEDIPSNAFGISGAKNTSSFSSFVQQIRQPNSCRGGY